MTDAVAEPGAPAGSEGSTAVPVEGTERAVAAETPVGGGDARGGEEAAGNPFDFTQLKDDGGGGGAAAEESGEYAPDFGANFNEDEGTRASITKLAREAGIEAGAAGKLVAGMCDYFKAQAEERATADYEGLRKAWGAKFEANMQATGRHLKGMLARGEITQAEAGELMRPAVYKVVHALLGRLGEGKVAGGSAQGTPSSREAALRDAMENPHNELYKILANPRHPQYEAAKQQFNALAGARIY